MSDIIAQGMAAAAIVQADIRRLPVAGLLAEYRFEEASGSVAYDSGPMGNHGAYVGAPSMVDGGGFTAASGKYATIPDAVNTAWQTAIIVGNVLAPIVTFADAKPEQSWLGSSAATGNVITFNAMALQVSLPTPCWSYNNHASTTRGYEVMPMGMNMVSLVSTLGGGTNDVLYINDHEVITHVSTGDQKYVTRGSTSGNFRTGTGQIGANTGGVGAGYTLSYCDQNIYYAAFYSTKLTAAQIAAAYRRIIERLRARGNPLTIFDSSTANSNQLLAVGDSITSGPTGVTPWCVSLNGGLSDYYETSKLAFTGIGISQLQSNGAQILSYGLSSPGVYKRVVVIFAGTNDIATGNSAALTWTRIAKFSTLARSLGFKVIVVNMISRTGQDAGKNALNTLIAAGSAFYDGLANVAANTNLGADGAYSNTTYFQGDGIHPTATGMALIKGIVQTAVNAVAYP